MSKITQLNYVNGVHYDLDGNKIPVSDLLSPEPHPDDISCTLELRQCKSPEEKFRVLEKYGFTAGQKKVEATDSQKK